MEEDKPFKLVLPTLTDDHYILDANGNPQRCDDLYEWGMFMQDRDRRRVAQDLDEGNEAKETRVCVSTVFLGLDHRLGGKGPPILWETMVFGGVLNHEMQRYTSKEDALRGHQEMCRRVSETIHRK